MAKLFANSGDPDQIPHFVASDLGLHCFSITLLGVSRLQWVKMHVYTSKRRHPVMKVFVYLFKGRTLQKKRICSPGLWIPSQRKLLLNLSLL